MFKLNEIKELIKLVDQTSIHELEIENEGTRLAIRKPGKTEIVQVQSAAAPVTNVTAAPASVQIQPSADSSAVIASGEAAPRAQEANANLHTIVSPMVGTFYRSSSPEKAPYVSVGDKVSDKTTVCIIEAMKLMNELEAEVKGEIVEILAENGQLVEYGQPLFLVKPE